MIDRIDEDDVIPGLGADNDKAGVSGWVGVLLSSPINCDLRAPR